MQTPGPSPESLPTSSDRTTVNSPCRPPPAPGPRAVAAREEQAPPGRHPGGRRLDNFTTLMERSVYDSTGVNYRLPPRVSTGTEKTW